MIEWLAEAVIADLATRNFNVGWELGLRHVMQASRTVLISPEATSAPLGLNLPDRLTEAALPS
jgi:hypothetical protein